MLPVFIMAIEDDSDRQFAAELYHSYHSIMHQKALSMQNSHKILSYIFRLLSIKAIL